MGLARPYVRLPRAVSRSYAPAELAGLYQFPRNVVGPDQTIGVIELGGGYRPADIRAAFAKWDLPAPLLTDVPVGGASNSPGGDADVEVALDVEIVAVIYAYCTGRPARVRVYFAPNTDAGFAAAVRQAALDGCATISISWGASEDTWGAAAIRDFDATAAAAVGLGSVIFAASGDNLSDDGDNDGGLPDCDFPAASPHVVGCGGTTKSPTAEVVWNEGGGGTGGGYSAFFPSQPWQIGAPTGPGRMVPDVAADADPATGYRVFVNGAWTVVGGTSAVAPLYAGLFAAVSSAAAQAGRPKLGNILPFLYKHPACFVDVTSGNNGAWKALSGPDPCTGLGVPNGTALLNAVLGTVTQPPAPPPAPPPSPPPVPPSPPEPQPVTQVLNGNVKIPIFGNCPMTGVITTLSDHGDDKGSPEIDPRSNAAPAVTIPQPILDLLDKYGKVVGMVLLSDLPAVLWWKTKTWSDVLKDVEAAITFAA